MARFVMPDFVISKDATTLMRDAAARILAWSQEAIAARGVFHIALSGGNTPNALYSVMAGADYRQRFDWEKTHLWWSDERYLRSHDKECNNVMANSALIDHITIPSQNVHRVLVDLPVDEAAAEYEAEIVRNIRSAGTPRFDVVLLGLGNDGHTASLFPGTTGTLPADRLVIAHYVPQVSMWRITFTPMLINAARHVAFLVSGTGKAEIVRRVTREEYQPEVLPAQLVNPQPGDLTWMLDAGAAANI